MWLDNANILDDNGIGGIRNTVLETNYHGCGYNTNPLGLPKQIYAANQALPWIRNEMAKNRLVQIGWYYDGGSATGHASLITRVRYLSDFSKFRIDIMNPNGGQSTLRRFNSIYQIFSIWRN